MICGLHPNDTMVKEKKPVKLPIIGKHYAVYCPKCKKQNTY